MTDRTDAVDPGRERAPGRAHRAREWRDAGFDVAWRILLDRRRAAEVVEDVLGGLAGPEDADVGPTVLIRARRAALALRGQAGSPGGGDPDTGLVFADDVGALRDAAAEIELALGVIDAMGAADASIVDLHLRFGVPAAALAEDLAADPEAAAVQLHRLTGRLEGALAAWVLWNDGHPKCDELAELVALPGTSWGPAVARRIARHAVGCERCRLTLRDEDVTAGRFAATPVLRAPMSSSGPEGAHGTAAPADQPAAARAAVDTFPTAGHEAERAGHHDAPEEAWEDGSALSRRFAIALLGLLVVVAAMLTYVLVTAPDAGGP